MAYRPPTMDEVKKRANDLFVWVGFSLYALVGLGGGYLFAQWVHDPEWQNIFFSVWWLPSGVLAWGAKNWLENSLFSWVSEDPR